MSEDQIVTAFNDLATALNLPRFDFIAKTYLEYRRDEVQKGAFPSPSDPYAPTLPLELWERGEIGKFYRPLKTAISVRVDNDVLA